MGRTEGPHTSRPGYRQLDRGSRRRLRRLKWREHTPTEFWIMVAVVLVIFLIAVQAIIRYPPSHVH
jgi:hypothetical protein